MSEEYWRPVDPVIARIARPILAEALCPGCGAQYASEARFCHICGTERNRSPIVSPRPLSFGDFFDVAIIRQRFHLSIPSLVFFVLGVVCMVVASGISILYKATTLVEWQALQLWRVAWLLGAAAAMLAGILLKKK